MRLCGRFRSLARKGKRPTVVATAIARELAAFIWAINREVVGSHATANLNRKALAFLRLASIRLMLRKLCNPV
jgi:hypothetical protein